MNIGLILLSVSVGSFESTCWHTGNFISTQPWFFFKTMVLKSKLREIPSGGDSAVTAKDLGSIPGQGTKGPQAVQQGQKPTPQWKVNDLDRHLSKRDSWEKGALLCTKNTKSLLSFSLERAMRGKLSMVHVFMVAFLTFAWHSMSWPQATNFNGKKVLCSLGFEWGGGGDWWTLLIITGKVHIFICRCHYEKR